MKTISDRIKSAEIDKTVNAEKQNRHIRGNSEYDEGRSFLLDGIDPQELVDRYHGTGEISFTRKGEWDRKEIITADMIIGVSVDKTTNKRTPTQKFKIHYSKTGTHIVPTLKG